MMLFPGLSPASPAVHYWEDRPGKSAPPPCTHHDYCIFLQSPTLLHSPTTVEESARVAQVMDELEKRDKAIARLKKENELLKVGGTL